MQPRFFWPAILIVLCFHQLQADAVLSKTALSASGRQESILTIGAFGRYSISVGSKQGTALQLIDRMSGPGELRGKTGEKDGRIDLLLDRGQYKIVAYGPEHAPGSIQLQAHSFQEQNTPQPSLLPELKLIHEKLDDYQQLSYWIQVTEVRTVSIEAAGRNLTDLRLWQDGNWLVDATPLTSVIQPKVGQPLLYCRLSATLNPGLYLFTAYGGLAQPWAQDSPDHPIFLRSGIPMLPEAGRQRMIGSPFGIDRWLVPGSATYFRLELPEAKPASLELGWFDPNQPFSSPQTRNEISKKSLLPVASVEGFGDPAKNVLVTITVEPGQPYVFQQFEKRCIYSFRRVGNYWLSTIHSGHPSDSVDATALVNRILQGEPEPVPYLSQTIELDSSHGWKRQFNLMDTLTLFVHIKDQGQYEILAKETAAEFRFEPFLIDIPEHYEAPPFRGPGSVWKLDAGYYVLTAQPLKKGILTLGVRPTGLVDFMKKMVGVESEPEKAAVRASIHFPEVALNLDYTYSIYINTQPEVATGVILRLLPLDLTEALFVSLLPGETISIPSTMGEAGAVRAIAEDGSLLEVSNKADLWRKTLQVARGTQTIRVKNPGNETVQASVVFERSSLQASTPLPPLPDAALAALPKFEEVTETSPSFFNLARDGYQTFELHAATPGLYVIESTGLLATQGNLRTRTNPSFARNSQNGTGRNFLIQQYLREGDYQITVSAQGESQGHLGIRVVKTHLQDGGVLTDQLAARVSVAAGDAVLYRFRIKKEARFHLRSFGIDRVFLSRLEDEDGWPITTPNIAADLDRTFDPGSYRFLLMPEAVQTRRLTLLQRIAEPQTLEGHGPLPLSLGQQAEHLWREPKAGEDRKPDVWLITIPAPVDAQIALSEEMQGELLLSNQNAALTRLAYVPAEKSWKGHLEMGSYRLSVVNARRNDLVNYTISIQPDQLVEGTERSISAPGSIDVSVGSHQLIELGSFGSTDVRGRLLDHSGRIVASNDDRPDDWNFDISQTLKPGLYRLEVEPVGRRGGQVSVSMKAPVEVLQPSLALPVSQQIDPGLSVSLYPLTFAPDARLLSISSRSAETIGIAVETDENGSWQSIGTSTGHTARLAFALTDSTTAHYRLRVWSVDHRNIPLSLTAAAIAVEPVGETQLAAGLALQQIPGIEPAISVALIHLDRPGVFRVETDAEKIRWSAKPVIPARAVENHLIPAATTELWVLKDLAQSQASAIVRATRVLLASGEEHEINITLDPGSRATVDLAAGEQQAVVAMVESAGGQPAIGLVQNGAQTEEFLCIPQNLAVGTQSSVSVSLHAANEAAVLWAVGQEPVRARIHQITYIPSLPESVSWGIWHDSIKGTSARVLQLPVGNKKIRLTLESHTIAATADGPAIKSVHWNNDRPFSETIETTVDRLIVFHTGESEDRLQIETVPLEITQWTRPLSIEAPYKQRQPDSGALRIGITPSAGIISAMVHVRGAGAESVLITRSGGILRGRDLTLPPEGGELRIEHGPGLLLAWIEAPESATGIWGADTVQNAKEVAVPSSIPLAAGNETFRIRTGHVGLLQVRTSCPAMVRIVPEGGETQVEVFERGVLLSAYLPQGNAGVTLRGLAGETLSGAVDFSIADITNAVEGLGAASLLPAGATRVYAFHVKREGPIGIGVWSDSGTAEGTLLDAAGNRLGSGVVQMPTLKPGVYLLAIHAPENGKPVLVRPALAGIETPSPGPPDDAIRGYIVSAKNYKPQDSIAFVAPHSPQFDTSDPTANSYDNYDDESEYSDDEE